jgi:hypothetical protein
VGLEEGDDLTELAEVDETLGLAQADEGFPAFGLEVVDVAWVDYAPVAVGEGEENADSGGRHAEYG